jgi:DNA-binding winged helix-turn-helix (wHTH) protein
MVRRVTNDMRTVRRFGAFELDSRTGELFKSGRRVHLTPQAARVLLMLTNRPGDVVTRDEIRQTLWGGHTFVDFDAAMNACISQVRTALGDRASAPRWVETVPRRGYRFVAAIEEMPHAATPEPAMMRRAPDRPAPRTRSAFWAAAGIVVAIAAGASVWLTLSRGREPVPDLRIGVLPIDSAAGDPALRSLGVLLQERTLVALFEEAGATATIVARPAVEHLRGNARTIAALAELQLDFFVDASLEALPDQTVRLHTKIVRGGDLRILSAQDYVLPADHLAARRQDLASEMAHRLLTALARSGMSADAADVNARDLGLTGEGALDRGDDAELPLAIDRLELSLAADPNNLWTRGLLARALVRAALAGVRHRDVSLTRARQEALTVLAGDRSRADAWAALGATQLWLDADLDAAGRSLQRAAHAPDAAPDAIVWFAAWLRASGRHAESASAAATLARIRPFSCARLLRRHREVPESYAACSTF